MHLSNPNPNSTVTLEALSDPLGEHAKRLLSIGEVGVLLSVSRSKAYQLVTDGCIPSIRIGRCVKVHPDDLSAFIQSCRVAGGRWES
jgi:excisionase family DNA binding protein